MPISDQNDATIPLSNIINLDELHRTLNKLGLQSRLVDKPVKYTNSFYQGWEWTPVPRGNLIDRLLELRREPGEYLSIGTLYLAYEPSSSDEQNSYRHMHHLIYNLITEIKFNPMFYREARKYMPPKPYLAVHLRAEDDFFHHLGPLNHTKYGHFYLHQIELRQNGRNVFVATHLTKAPYELNWLVKDDFYMTPSQLNLPWKGREINAIIDYIICQEGEDFLGLKASTFSLAIAWMKRLNKRPYAVLRFNTNEVWITDELGEYR